MKRRDAYKIDIPVHVRRHRLSLWRRTDLVPPELPHDSVHHCLLDYDVENKLLLRHPLIGVSCTQRGDTVGCTSLHRCLGVRLLYDLTGVQSIELSSEGRVAVPNLLVSVLDLYAKNINH